MSSSITASKVFVEGMTAVITGASSGIGRAMAMTCAAKGMNVWMVDIDQDELDTAKELVMGNRLNQGTQVRCHKACWWYALRNPMTRIIESLFF